MKKPIIRSFNAHFPRLISGTRYNQEALKQSPKDTEMRDVEAVTKAEQERKKAGIKNMKRYFEDLQEARSGSGCKKQCRQTDTIRKPISFASL
jgi:hypothetical protein